MATKSTDYWRQRSAQRIVDSEALGQTGIEVSIGIYETAYRNIQKEIANVYKNYAKKIGETTVLDPKELKKSIGKYGTEEFLRKITDAATKLGLNPDKIYDERYLYRLTRLQALQEQIKLEVMAVARQEQLVQSAINEKIMTNAYKSILGDLQEQGISPSFAVLDKGIVNQLLKTGVKGVNFSDRVWGNTQILAAKLPTIIGNHILTGSSIEKTSRDVRDRFDVSLHQATTLIRTEVGYFRNQGELQSYVDNNIEEYDFDAVMDEVTTPVCRHLNGKRFKTADAMVGVNWPPMLPNCRSGTLAVVNEDWKQETPEDRVDRFGAIKDPILEERYRKAMQKQMNPDQAAHDYNADMNILTQNLKNKVITKTQFNDQLQALMKEVPKDYPLRPALENIAGLHGWKPTAEDAQTAAVRKKVEGVGLKFDEAKLTPKQVNFLDKAEVNFDATEAEAALLDMGQYNSDKNQISIAQDRINIAKRTLDEPNLYEAVFKHELGHAVDNFANKLQPGGDRRFSYSDKWESFIRGDLLSGTSSKQAMAIAKSRFTQALGDVKTKDFLNQLSIEEFAKQVDDQGAIKIGKKYTEVPLDQMLEFVGPRELFAEAYSLYYVNPSYLKNEAPDMYTFINSISEMHL